MKKIGACAGKFRIIHIGHIQYFLQATLLNDVVHIFFVSNSNVERLISEEDTVRVLKQIFDSLGKEYYIHQTDFKEGEDWDNYLIETIGTRDFTIYNSKENYDNILVKNSYLKCLTDENISASNIYQNVYQYENFNLIAPEYQKYLKQDIYLDTKDDFEFLDTCLRKTYGESRFNFKQGYQENKLSITRDECISTYEFYKQVILKINQHFEIVR